MKDAAIKDAVVAFFDILGFAKLTELAHTDPEKAINTARQIESAFARIYKDHKDLEDLGTQVRMFSDNVCISDPFDSKDEYLVDNLFHLLATVRFIQTDMILAGYFIRGGIAIGPHYMSEYTIFGPALVNAYRTESKVAQVPRIVVHSSYVAALKKAKGVLGDHQSQLIWSYLIKDADKQYFLDYLAVVKEFEYEDEVHELFDTHKKMILRQVGANVGNLDVLNKYVWVAEYHNAKVQELLNNPKEYLVDLETTFPAKAKNPIRHAVI